MKSRIIFIVLLFCCFGFMGCDEFGVKSITGYIYLGLMENKTTNLVWNVNGYEWHPNTEIESDDWKKKLKDTFPEETLFFDCSENENLYSFLLDLNLESRENFLVSIFLFYGNKTYTGTIEIPYLIEGRNNKFSFSLLSDAGEILNGVFIYHFRYSI